MIDDREAAAPPRSLAAPPVLPEGMSVAELVLLYDTALKADAAYTAACNRLRDGRGAVDDFFAAEWDRQLDIARACVTRLLAMQTLGKDDAASRQRVLVDWGSSYGQHEDDVAEAIGRR